MAFTSCGMSLYCFGTCGGRLRGIDLMYEVGVGMSDYRPLIIRYGTCT